MLVLINCTQVLLRRCLIRERGNLEVSHRFYIHDAEHAASILFEENADSFTSSALPSKFGRYVHQSFVMRNQRNEKLPLSYLGVQVEGKFIYILQEISLSKIQGVLSVSFPALTEIWPSQRNAVNFIYDKKVGTLIFGEGDSSQEIDITKMMN